MSAAVNGAPSAGRVAACHICINTLNAHLRHEGLDAISTDASQSWAWQHAQRLLKLRGNMTERWVSTEWGGVPALFDSMGQCQGVAKWRWPMRLSATRRRQLDELPVEFVRHPTGWWPSLGDSCKTWITEALGGWDSPLGHTLGEAQLAAYRALLEELARLAGNEHEPEAA